MEAEEYRFEGVTGWAWYHPTLTDSDGSQTVWASGDDVFAETNLTLNHTDDGTSMALEGTICLVPDQEEHIYYVNPVYQDSNGEVYAVSGNGYSTGTAAAGEREEREYFTVTLSQTVSTSTDSISTSEGTSVTIHMIGQYAPTDIFLLQMAEDNTILSRVSYAPETLPEAWTPEEECAYLIVETHRTDSSGQETISRKLFSPENESFLTYFAKDGVCISQENRVGGDLSHPTRLRGPGCGFSHKTPCPALRKNRVGRITPHSYLIKYPTFSRKPDDVFIITNYSAAAIS